MVALIARGSSVSFYANILMSQINIKFHQNPAHDKAGDRAGSQRKAETALHENVLNFTH